MFDVGSLQGTLELDRTPFAAGLRAARMEGQRFEHETFTATVDANADTLEAQRKLDEVARDRTVKANLDLDTAAAEAKIELLNRQAAGIGGGVGGVGGGGSAGGGGFGMPSLGASAIGLGALFAPTIGAAGIQGALGAGALGVGAAGAGAVGLGGIASVAAPAITQLKTLATAQDAYNKAVLTYGKNSTEATTALKNLQSVEKALPAQAAAVMDSLKGLKSEWAQASMPGQRDFFGLINDGIKEADRLMPMFARSADRSMSAARSAADDFLKSLNSQDFHTFLQTMTSTFVHGVGPMEVAFENIARILGRIAVAVAPDVLHMLEGFASTTQQWEQSTRNAADLRKEVHSTVRDFDAWVDVARSLGHLVSALFITNRQGAHQGRQQLEAMSRQLDVWSNWIAHHHHDINAFFGTLQDSFGLLLSSAGEIAKVVLPAFKPVADVIHEVVSDLNSIKVGNISALTILLGIMAGRGIAGKLGLAAGGLTTAEAAGAGGAGGIGLGALAARAGSFLLSHPMAGPTAAGAGAAVAFQSLAGKPGSFLGPGIAGFVPSDKDTRQRLNKLLAIQANYHHASLSQLNDFRDRAQSDWELAFETDPNSAMHQGGDVLTRTAHDTFHEITKQIRAVNLGTTIADAVGAGKGDVRQILKQYEQRFEALPPAAQDAAIKSAKQELDGLKQMGLITKKQERQTLNDLEDQQNKSLRDQRQKWDQFGQNVNHLVSHWFGSMAGTVDTLLGNKGITGMVNQLLTGVASQHKLKWNATTLGRTAGTLAGFLGIGGGQRGGFTGGFSSFDDRMIPVRGNEAVLRGEDHVPIVSRALQNTYGFGLGDLFNRTGGSASIGAVGYQHGGGVKYSLPWPGGTSQFGELDRGIDVGGTGPVFAMDSGTVTRPNFNLFSSYGSATSGLVYKMDHPPKGYNPSSPYVYIYELFNPSGNAHGKINAGQTLGHITGGSGIEMGWAANASGEPLADALGEDIAARHTLPRGLPTSISLQNFIRDVQSGKHIAGGASGVGHIPKIVIHGPKGGIHDGLQGIADKSRAAANAYIDRQAAKASASTGGGFGNISAGSVEALARKMVISEWGAGQWPPFVSLEMGEAGWDVHAQNPRSSAYGLAQNINPSTYPAAGRPGSTAPLLDQAKAQLTWMLNYISDRYGDPASAWSAWQSRDPHWYRMGGSIPPGGHGVAHSPEILVSGGAHGTSVVSQQDTMRILRRAASGGGGGRGGGVNVSPQVHIHGDIIPHPGYESDPVQMVLADPRFYDALEAEIGDSAAFDSQLARMGG